MAPNSKSENVRVVIGPRRTNGSVSRMVELADGTGRVETWGASGWTPGGASPASVMKGPSVSEAFLDELGVPGSDR